MDFLQNYSDHVALTFYVTNTTGNTPQMAIGGRAGSRAIPCMCMSHTCV